MRNAPSVRHGPAYMLLAVRRRQVLGRKNVRAILGVIIDGDIVCSYGSICGFW